MQHIFSHYPTLFLGSGRNESNEALYVKKPFANSNNASMSLWLYLFHEGIEFKGDETFGISSPSGKSAIIKSNPPNLQMLDETQAFWVWPTYKQSVHISQFQKLSNTCWTRQGTQQNEATWMEVFTSPLTFLANLKAEFSIRFFVASFSKMLEIEAISIVSVLLRISENLEITC